jgi:hypothetical protein
MFIAVFTKVPIFACLEPVKSRAHRYTIILYFNITVSSETDAPKWCHFLAIPCRGGAILTGLLVVHVSQNSVIPK